MTGLLLVDKPQGPTSHDIISDLRRGLGIRKAGHCGTLDPMATGLLLVLTEGATRMAEIFAKHEKVYRGTVTLGRATDSDDAEGEVISELAEFSVTDAAIERALSELAEIRTQRPPAYSAIKVGGVPHYRLMRQGKVETSELPERPVRIERLELVDRSARELTIEVHCSAGTYVRAIARDLGERLGVPAHLSALRRLRSGQFSVDDALDPKAIVQAEVTPWLSLAEALAELPSAAVRECYRVPLSHGAQPRPEDLALAGPLPAVGSWMRLLAPDGQLLAIARVEADPEPRLRLRRSLGG